MTMRHDPTTHAVLAWAAENVYPFVPDDRWPRDVETLAADIAEAGDGLGVDPDAAWHLARVVAGGMEV